MPANVKGLNTLIKLQRRELDDLRRKLSVLERQREALVMLSSQLIEELEREIELAIATADMGSFFGNYAERIQQRQEQIRQEVLKINKEMAKISAEIAIKFGDLKKYEIARDQRIAAAKAEENRKETMMLDEIAMQQFVRKGGQGE